MITEVTSIDTPESVYMRQTGVLVVDNGTGHDWHLCEYIGCDLSVWQDLLGASMGTSVFEALRHPPEKPSVFRSKEVTAYVTPQPQFIDPEGL